MVSPQVRKIVIYAIVAIAAVWLGGCIYKRAQPAYVTWNLKRLVRNIEPWTASTNYTAAGWNHLVKTARVFQQSTPRLAEEALDAHFKDAARNPVQLSAEQAKVFLLLRMMFDLPEDAPPEQRFSFADWTRARTDVNPDGTVNLAWPLRTTGGAPRLVAGCEGTAGNYSAKEEFAFLRYRFPNRDLGAIQWENQRNR
jgi:hypothetical protein